MPRVIVLRHYQHSSLSDCRNDYYGGESASLNLTQLYEKFRPGQAVPKDLGRDRDWQVDLIPKFMMSNGELVKMLVHTEVTRYMEYKQIAGSYVFRDGRISKVPSTEMEAVRSPLMGLFEKRRAKKFFEWVQGGHNTMQLHRHLAERPAEILLVVI